MESNIEEFVKFKQDSNVKVVQPYRKIIAIYYGKLEDEIVEEISKETDLNTQIYHLTYIIPYLKWLNGSVSKIEELRLKVVAEKDKIKKEKLKIPLLNTRENGLKPFEEIPTDTYANTMKKLIFQFYINETWILRSDIITLKYRRYDANTENYVYMNKCVFNTLKKKPTEKKTYDIKKETMDLITKLLSFPEAQNSDYILDLRTGSGKVPNDRADFLRDYLMKHSELLFGKRLGVNDFRKLFCSENAKDVLAKLKNNEISIAQAYELLKECADNSNHSIDVHMNNYVQPIKEAQESQEESQREIQEPEVQKIEPEVQEEIKPEVQEEIKPEIQEEIKPESKPEPVFRRVVIRGIELEIERGVPFYIDDVKFVI